MTTIDRIKNDIEVRYGLNVDSYYELENVIDELQNYKNDWYKEL